MVYKNGFKVELVQPSHKDKLNRYFSNVEPVPHNGSHNARMKNGSQQIMKTPRNKIKIEFKMILKINLVNHLLLWSMFLPLCSLL